MTKWVFLFLGLLTIKYAFAIHCYETTKEKLVNGRLSPLVKHKTVSCDSWKISRLFRLRGKCYELKVTEENGEQYVTKGCIKRTSSKSCEKMVEEYKAFRSGGNQNSFHNITKRKVYSDPSVYCRECSSNKCNKLGNSAADHHISYNLFVPLFTLTIYIIS